MGNNMRISPLLAALTGAATVAAHGHVTQLVINGVAYQGYDPTSFPYMENPPTVVGWSADQPDNGFVEPSSAGSPDIICHKSAKPAGGHASVKAGDSISIQWDTWPESHHGPMIDYLAPCNGACESVDKEALEFFKIDGAGIADASVGVPGNWASDVLIENNFTWLVQVPSDLAPGNYVLRHETIALHSAGQKNGAQFYPQCFNLEVTGSGSNVPAGTLGTELYKAADPGILMDIYTEPLNYEMPGPALIEGAKSSVAQSSSKATSTGTATVGSGNGGGNAPAPTTTADEQPTTTAQAPTTTAQAPTTTAQAPTTAQPAPTQAPQPTTFSTSATATSSAPVGAQTLYGQCGGKQWTGATACAEGSCTMYNDYYAQCVN